MTKFVIGILCAAAGFGLMMLAAQNVLSNGGPVCRRCGWWAAS